MSRNHVSSLLITGTDTSVGKTWISCLLIHHLAAAGLRVGAYKPVCSGAERNTEGKRYWSDADLLLQACRDHRSLRPAESSRNHAQITLDMVCPQRFVAAVAPNVAARLQHTSVDPEMLTGGLKAWQNLADIMVVEGAGGLLCPLSDHQTVADLAVELNCPVVIVAANRLGVINHTLLTVGIAQSRGLAVKAVILNETSPPAIEHAANDCTAHANANDPSRESNADQLQHWIPDVPLFHCQYRHLKLTPLNNSAETCDWAGT